MTVLAHWSVDDGRSSVKSKAKRISVGSYEQGLLRDEIKTRTGINLRWNGIKFMSHHCPVEGNPGGN
jgi:hypothetical protein